jgi:8-oxo-dGTP pyrophosphatase MutT (NUDIX family)
MNLNVEKLLNDEIDRKYDDRVFWYASKVIIEENEVNIYIDNENLVTFDDIDLDIKKISEFKNIKQKNNFILENVLISSGSFLFINDKLVVTQRELDTSFDPGFWTTPAGRCDRTILETGIKETIEEIKIEKNRCVLYPDVSKEFLNVKENIKFYKTRFSNKKNLLKVFNIKLFLDNIKIESCKSWMYYSKEVNTIEFRLPIFAELEESELRLSNPEFGTDTDLKSIEELQKLDTVPALKKLLEEITES